MHEVIPCSILSRMIPVRLELQNFLSYGTEAPALEFDEFDVACLSGGNGEGKSALLDAMTWALWGEARKSSGKRKPDDELIRIGSRHMEVTFTFDLEDTRYRVTRSFSRSATGKTTSSDLEFQLYNPETDDYRPLTGSTQRETQGRIEDTLGLDYDTFINSAFLLQGRSDEFTDKSPSQRKEILVSILNLSRYEKLEAKARDRWREAKKRQQRTEAEVERLQEAVADVPEWEERREEVRAEVEEKQETVSELREQEKALTQQLADREAKVREREAIHSAIEDLDQRITEQKDTLETLDENIAQADELLEDREEIEAAHERYQSLQEERDLLDEKRDLHRGLEKQIEQVESTLQERTNKLERRLDRLTVERKSLKKDLDECETQLAQRSAVQEKLRQAQAARQQVREWEAVRGRRERLKAQQEEARRALVGARQQLKAELDALQEQIEEEREAVSTLDSLDERIDTLEKKEEKLARLEEQLEAVESKGKRVAQQIQELEGQLEARREECDQDRAELQRFRAAEGPSCPTCGTELTPTHRDEVETTLQSSIDELQQAITDGEDQLQDLTERRTRLREKYTRLRKRVQALDSVEGALATAREQYRSLRERAEDLDTHRQQARAIQQSLQQRSYGMEDRRRWQWCAQRRAELRFDSDAFESLKNRAAQLDRHSERLRELNELEGRRNELQRKLDHHDEEIESLRTQLEEGTAFEELQERRETLQQQLADVDFDPDRFQEVRRALQELTDVPDRRSELKHAENNRAEWVVQRDRVSERLRSLREERQDKQEQKEALTEALEETMSLDDEVEAVEDELKAAEEALNEAQQTLGMLNERLEQAQRDQDALDDAREELDACTNDRQLYKHLRGVFGKHGIPSLIIEETLPEIEERANRILDRLTDGRMRVRLETLKEKKSGGTKETLDIIITDEQGVPRPYETFSGGESFRVNFALRVALAQLLADRSGVRVRTLVIDEGFGTQDETGIQRLVEAIQAIREDFAKILVITHLQRLKQAFPVRIEVEKDPAIGSTFEVVGG
jgi:exonuclease SbcC